MKVQKVNANNLNPMEMNNIAKQRQLMEFFQKVGKENRNQSIEIDKTEGKFLAQLLQEAKKNMVSEREEAEEKNKGKNRQDNENMIGFLDYMIKVCNKDAKKKSESKDNDKKEETEEDKEKKAQKEKRAKEKLEKYEEKQKRKEELEKEKNKCEDAKPKTDEDIKAENKKREKEQKEKEKADKKEEKEKEKLEKSKEKRGVRKVLISYTEAEFLKMMLADAVKQLKPMEPKWWQFKMKISKNLSLKYFGEMLEKLK